MTLWKAICGFLLLTVRPSRAEFSKEPHFNDNNAYFPGTYTLQLGTGENLQSVLAKLIAKNRSPHTRIIVGLAANNEVAKRFGWSDTEAMKQGIEGALQILPLAIANRVAFEAITTNDWLRGYNTPASGR